MQAQQTRNTTQSITHTQSLTAVKTLLQAGLGAITYLRNLLPEDNFSSSHFTTSEDSLLTRNSDTSFSPEALQSNNNSRNNVNRFRIMSMTRGYTDEADKILNYMEYGIFDALEKNYLQSFIFAIYLVWDIRGHQYHTLPGSDLSIPVMSLGEDLENLSVDQKSKNIEDPVAKAIRSGKAPTVKDVKMSLKVLLKTLMHAMHHMEILPRRRFATFKVFYTPETPADYEPPHFKAGDADKDKWYLMTHDLSEVPDKIHFGKLDTGHHCVNLSVTSIASFLPSSTEQDDLAFTGTTTYPNARPTLSPIQEATFCKQQAEKQREDAETRNIVWSGENSLELDDLADADCDDDPDYIRLPDGRYQEINAMSPIGIRNKDGDIEAIYTVPEQSSEAQFGGFSEKVPMRLQDIVSLSTLPPSSEDYFMSSPVSSALTPTSSFDPDMLKTLTIRESETFDTEMLGIEQNPFLALLIISILPTGAQVLESIQSFGQETTAEVIQPANMRHGHDERERSDNGLDCFCKVAIEDELLFCDSGCEKWFHVWSDPRLPPKFICFNCRVRADVTWELIRHDLYPRMLSRFKELALFRRAIKVAEKENIFTAAEFSKAFDKKEAILSRLFLKRLEKEEFILQESTAPNDFGLASTQAKSVKPKGKGKGKNKAAKPRRINQKIRYIFNHSIKSNSEYRDYFNGEVEARLLALSDTAVCIWSGAHSSDWNL
ncbi:hypothetical protein BYT27DRAFT_7095073 [Phlegmacium glaucopus]|nr:hypothetical protein BYT27DRAFT_7095073 [Phlegmacium glaucopus]